MAKASAATAPPPPSASILDDLNAGDEPIRLAELVHCSFVPRMRGRKPHFSWVYRIATGDGARKLETAKIGGVLVTTKSAYLRYVAACSGIPPGSIIRTAAQREREIAEVEERLEKAGI